MLFRALSRVSSGIVQVPTGRVEILPATSIYRVGSIPPPAPIFGIFAVWTLCLVPTSRSRYAQMRARAIGPSESAKHEAVERKRSSASTIEASRMWGRRTRSGWATPGMPCGIPGGEAVALERVIESDDWRRARRHAGVVQRDEDVGVDQQVTSDIELAAEGQAEQVQRAVRQLVLLETD